MFALTDALGGERVASPNGPGVTRTRFVLGACERGRRAAA
jgi:hypothetical protein